MFFVPIFVSAQTPNGCTTNEKSVLKVTTDKSGKKTTRECLFVTICGNVTEFRISHTSVQTFYHVEGSVWIDHNEKLVKVTKDNGIVTFTKGKTTFSYSEI